MKKQIVDENTVLEIGKFYNVRCALLTQSDSSERVVPVIGPAHVDKDFFNHKHYHIDGRFCGEKEMIDHDIDHNGRTNIVLYADEKAPWYALNVKEVVVRRRKCRRLTTGIIPPEIVGNTALVQWTEKMKGKSCAGKKCPHYGIKMHEIKGRLVCPLHNLMSDPTHSFIEGMASREFLNS